MPYAQASSKYSEINSIMSLLPQLLSRDYNKRVHGKWYTYGSGACPHTIFHSRDELPWTRVKLSWGAACLCAEVVRGSLGETNYTELKQNSFRQDFW